MQISYVIQAYRHQSLCQICAVLSLSVPWLYREGERHYSAEGLLITVCVMCVFVGFLLSHAMATLLSVVCRRAICLDVLFWCFWFISEFVFGEGGEGRRRVVASGEAVAGCYGRNFGWLYFVFIRSFTFTPPLLSFLPFFQAYLLKW